MLHSKKGGGEICMEVDHFDPRLKLDVPQDYGNLVLAHRSVNNKKRAKWPTAPQIAKGMRFIDPREELDYGNHIFENHETGELETFSNAGEYHVVQLGLNSRYLRDMRQERTRLLLKRNQVQDALDRNPSEQTERIRDLLREVTESLNDSIGAIPAWPSGHPKPDD